MIRKQMIFQSFGPMYIYSLNELKAWLSHPLTNVFGIRAVYRFSANNQVNTLKSGKYKVSTRR
ncbi:hypothetical protein [Ligilactobacillus acidipiscis]|uniref:hypothetical protein n=1 Tax=Ligilactobacillus acidipiscis TaxID=89059 RepID=UPI001E602DA9|nr:hypothetical protein [Ligilactobacillus acidipiscis]